MKSIKPTTGYADSKDLFIRVPISSEELQVYSQLRLRLKPPEVDDEIFNRQIFLFGLDKFVEAVNNGMGAAHDSKTSN